MQTIISFIHRIAYAYFIYLFGYASLFKVFQKQNMMEGMQSLGFGRTWTLLIGYSELLGVIGLIVGLRFHQVKNISVLWLFPFAVGALMVHFAHQDYLYFYDSLFGCIAAVVILGTDKYFRIEV
ncbi:MAG TPA: DoxX family protein [Phnomibacter sp.]|nr:DoxX family protein [Phnomibacter sp.]